MAKVIQFPNGADNAVSPESVLRAALEKDLEGVIVIGYNGEEGHFSYSVQSAGDLVLILERVKLKILMGEEDEEVS